MAGGPGNAGGLRGDPQRASLLICILGPQMVVVNSSSPTAACSGSWETRGMEESVPTTDGSAESLYVQGLAGTLAQDFGVGSQHCSRKEWLSGSLGKAGHFFNYYLIPDSCHDLAALSGQKTHPTWVKA